jgi:hypothetical protein
LTNFYSISFAKSYEPFAQVPKGGKAGSRKFGCRFRNNWWRQVVRLSCLFLTSRRDGRQLTRCFVSTFQYDNCLPYKISGRALKHRETINTFIYRHEDLIQYRLTEEDWRAIEMVTRWLKSFRSATTQMSATRSPMLSSTHAIFRGLQDDIKDFLRTEKGLSPRLIKGLSDAHLKLSEYYYKFDESPFYLWASRRSCLASYTIHIGLNLLTVLDPRISYSALSDEFEEDEDLAPFLETAKNRLHTYYKRYYVNPTNTAPSPALSSQSSQPPSSINGSPQKNFTARFRKPRAPIDELLEFWKLPQEDFETCNPIQWWSNRRSSFPNLYRLACDILSIPGGFLVLLVSFMPHHLYKHLPWQWKGFSQVDEIQSLFVVLA